MKVTMAEEYHRNCKEYAYWMEGVETLQPERQNQRVVKLEDGVLNHTGTIGDTPRP